MNDFLGAQKVLSHPERYAEWYKSGDTSAPVSVKLDLTNVCCHNCPGCIDGALHRSKDKLDFDRLAQLLAEFKSIGVKGISITGGGEPTLYGKFKEVVDVAYENGLEIGLLTNGQILKDLDLWKLVQKCAWIRISLDAYNAETYKKSHGSKADLDKTMCGIKDLVAQRRVTGSQCTIGTGYLTNQYIEMDRHVDSFVMLSKHLGVDYAQLRPSVNAWTEDGGAYKSDYDGIGADEWKLLFEKCMNYEDRYFAVKIDEYKYNRIFSGDLEKKYRFCHGQAFKSTNICANGNVIVCCHLAGDSYAIGNIYDNSFEDIWKSRLRKSMVKSIDVRRCPPLCICDSLNEFLDGIRGYKHVNSL